MTWSFGPLLQADISSYKHKTPKWIQKVFKIPSQAFGFEFKICNGIQIMIGYECDGT